MAAPEEKSFYLLEYHTNKSVVTVQRAFRANYAKDLPTRPFLFGDLAALKTRIITAMKNIDAPLLTRVWQELEYRIDVCRVTRGAHIEHL
jgi:hypothetical protein